MKKVIVGGTFDLLHAGHKALLLEAFLLGEVIIGLVSDEMAKISKNREVGKYKDRQKELENWIKKPAKNSGILAGPPESKGFGGEIKKSFRIVEINDRFGPALKEDFDYIVVSPETYETAVLINKERQKLNKKPIEIVRIEFVLAEDGKPISSTRIFKGEIDREGKLLGR
jgi:pantetheine-phosphate adenylyltransferase